MGRTSYSFKEFSNRVLARLSSIVNRQKRRRVQVVPVTTPQPVVGRQPVVRRQEYGY